MPVANIAEARDFMCGVIKTAWAASSAPAGWSGSWPPTILWPDVAGEPPKSGAYAEVEIQHQGGGNVAIGDSGNRRIRAKGVLTVCVFTDAGDGLTLSDYIANIVQRALEARQTPDKVQFRDVRVVDDGRVEKAYKVRVVSNIEYDRVN